MILPDVNVLVAAARQDATKHAECNAWLQSAIESEAVLGLSEVVLSGVVRICTHPRIFGTPSTIDEVLGFCNALREQPNVVLVTPGNRHWDIFCTLCAQADARGNLVSDAYLAALAIEQGAEWVTMDRDFARFPSLRWKSP